MTASVAKIVARTRAAVARKAHNLEVPGSTPGCAITVTGFPAETVWYTALRRNRPERSELTTESIGTPDHVTGTKALTIEPAVLDAEFTAREDEVIKPSSGASGRASALRPRAAQGGTALQVPQLCEDAA